MNFVDEKDYLSLQREMITKEQDYKRLVESLQKEINDLQELEEENSRLIEENEENERKFDNFKKNLFSLLDFQDKNFREMNKEKIFNEVERFILFYYRS